MRKQSFSVDYIFCRFLELIFVLYFIAVSTNLPYYLNERQTTFITRSDTLLSSLSKRKQRKILKIYMIMIWIITWQINAFPSLINVKTTRVIWRDRTLSIIRNVRRQIVHPCRVKRWIGSRRVCFVMTWEPRAPAALCICWHGLKNN